VKQQLLPASYYLDEDVVGLARDLLGKVLVTHFDGLTTSGIITETEAYRGPEDRASHAWNNRRTARTDVMFSAGGSVYVYLCYGIHHLFNVVTGPVGLPHAVLIRAIQPAVGEEAMLYRRRLSAPRKGWLTGPGTVAQAMHIKTYHNGLRLDDPNSPLQLFDAGITVPSSQILSSPRVGVQYAGADALLPWRFRFSTYEV
jgi:DNA-3-methyladenine glycosylase